MAQRFKAEQLKEMIRTLVREEIREVVVATINEVLTERYLRKLAESVVSARPRGVSDLDIMGDEEEPDEETPGPLSNSILAPGQENPRFKKVPKDDGVRQFHEGMDRNSMISLFFEGTKPLKESEANAPTAEELEASVGLPSREMKETIGVWNRLDEGMTQAALQRKQAGVHGVAPVVDLAVEEKRLAAARAALDRKP